MIYNLLCNNPSLEVNDFFFILIYPRHPIHLSYSYTLSLTLTLTFLHTHTHSQTSTNHLHTRFALPSPRFYPFSPAY